MGRRISGFVISLLVGAGAVLAQTVPASSDAHVSAAFPAVNFGTSPNLNVLGVAGSATRGYVRFDVSSIAAGLGSGTITKAYLVLWASRVPTPGTIQISEVTGSWVESSISNSFQPTVGAAVATASVSTEQSYVYVDITSLVLKWIATPASNHGIVIDPVGSTSVIFDSKESVTTSRPASLQVETNGVVGSTGATGVTGRREQQEQPERRV